MWGPFCVWGNRAVVALRTGYPQPFGDCCLRGCQSAPQNLVRGSAPHGKIAAQRHGTARDRDLRRDPGDLARPCPALQLLDTIGVHPETAATTADVPTAG
jgi:hypothetical protein